MRPETGAKAMPLLRWGPWYAMVVRLGLGGGVLQYTADLLPNYLDHPPPPQP